MNKSTTTKNRNKFDLSEFRTDITNNVEFKELKDKYNIKTHIEFEGLLYRLSQQDKKIYEYQIPETVRSLPVYESKDGFIKISQRTVNEFKSELGCETFEFDSVKLVEGKIVIELKTH